jgi:hypothetical protein
MARRSASIRSPSVEPIPALPLAASPSIQPWKHSSNGRGFSTHASVITPPTLWRAPSVKRVAVNRSRRNAEASCHPTFYLQITTKKRAEERTRTAHLSTLRVRGQWLLSVARLCKSRIDKGFTFTALPTIAGYCVRVRVNRVVSGLLCAALYCGPSGVRVVSEEGLEV